MGVGVGVCRGGVISPVDSGGGKGSTVDGMLGEHPASRVSIKSIVINVNFFMVDIIAQARGKSKGGM